MFQKWCYSHFFFQFLAFFGFAQNNCLQCLIYCFCNRRFRNLKIFCFSASYFNKNYELDISRELSIEILNETISATHWNYIMVKNIWWLQ